MAATILPSQAYLRECFDYDQASGALTWRERPVRHFSSESRSRVFNKQFSGKPALASLSGTGYLHGVLDMVGAKSHRVIWKWMTGEEPDQIDHINGDKLDNSWVNLRNVGYEENSKNHARASNNTSGVTGVVYWESRRRWKAQIKTGGRSRYLGCFATKEEATRARKRAELALGFHENHGREARWT